jgi:hypothetical protein
MNSKRFLGASLLSFASLLLATSCNNTAPDEVVTIHYAQVGACNGFSNGTNAASAGPHAAYVIFRITSVANQASAARDFNFDPNKLYIRQTSNVFANTQLMLASINPFAVKARFVAKATTETMNGAAIAIVSTTAADGESEAHNTSYFLNYDTPAGGQGVVLARADPTRTSWPDTADCTLVKY